MGTGTCTGKKIGKGHRHGKRVRGQDGCFPNGLRGHLEESIVAATTSASGQEIYSPGLEGVIAGETALSTVAEGLSYRGYMVTDLCGVVGFDEVAHLLLHGDLPTAGQLQS